MINEFPPVPFTTPNMPCQILINDQSSRNCAVGDIAKCPQERQGVSAGWTRFTPAVAPPPHKLAATADPEVLGASERNHDQLAAVGDVLGVEDGRGSGGRVEYRLHEFGLMYPSHAFTHWPGFSLNPALWDLTRLTDTYQRHFGRPFRFDTTDTRSVSYHSILIPFVSLVFFFMPSSDHERG